MYMDILLQSLSLVLFLYDSIKQFDVVFCEIIGEKKLKSKCWRDVMNLVW